METPTTEVRIFHAERGCLSYMIADTASRKVLLIDPSEEMGDAYVEYLKEQNLELAFTVETHTHADHISSGRKLKEQLGSTYLAHPNHTSSAKDKDVAHREILMLGSTNLTFLHTPGHTDDGLSVVTNDHVFTGDALLIEGTGRTDFQDGDSETLYETIWETLLLLRDDLVVHPSHNYSKETCSTISEEKTHNTRLQLSKEEFIEALDAHHPPKPEMFDEAIAKNSA